MTGMQNAIVRMFRTLKIYVTSHTGPWAANVPFKNAWNDFVVELNAIDLLSPIQAKQTQIATDPKTAQRHIVEEKTLTLATALSTYGHDTGNAAAVAAGKTTMTRLAVMEEGALRDAAEEMRLFAVGLGNGVLNDYGITAVNPDWLGNFMADVVAFKNMIGSPEAIRSEKKDATEGIATRIGTAQDILRNRLDGATRLLGITQPAFESGYFAARTVDKPSSRVRALAVRVVDDATGVPMAQVAVALSPSGKKRHTSAAGLCQANTLVEGVETIECSKAGYVKWEGTANITNGETAEVEVRMVGN